MPPVLLQKLHLQKPTATAFRTPHDWMSQLGHLQLLSVAETKKQMQLKKIHLWWFATCHNWNSSNVKCSYMFMPLSKDGENTTSEQFIKKCRQLPILDRILLVGFSFGISLFGFGLGLAFPLGFGFGFGCTLSARALGPSEFNHMTLKLTNIHLSWFSWSIQRPTASSTQLHLAAFFLASTSTGFTLAERPRDRSLGTLRCRDAPGVFVGKSLASVDSNMCIQNSCFFLSSILRFHSWWIINLRMPRSFWTNKSGHRCYQRLAGMPLPFALASSRLSSGANKVVIIHPQKKTHLLNYKELWELRVDVMTLISMKIQWSPRHFAWFGW